MTTAPLAIDVAARSAAIDHTKLRADRLARFRAELVRHDYSAALLSDPINIRYATGSRNMTVWTMHAPGRYAFVPVDGPVVLFEFATSKHVSRGLDTIDDLRDGVMAFYFGAGPRSAEMGERWARDVIDLVVAHGGTDRRLAVDRCEPWLAQHFEAAGIRLFDAQEPAEDARKIKSPEELQCLQLSIDVCDVAIDRMRAALQPGITENQLWAVLHETNIANDGEWIECRLLASGPRTNPWFQECGTRAIEAGDLLAFDTDMVGPNGYVADLSRTWVCPGRPATANGRRLYELAQEQVLTNIDVLRVGMSFREFSEKCWPLPEEFLANRYMVTAHGVGMVDEFPAIAYPIDFPNWGYDGVIEDNMVLCVESYLGEEGGADGVKLEEQVVITANGAVPMSRTPLVDALAV